MCISRVQLATNGEDSLEFIRGFELDQSVDEAMNAAIMAESDLKTSISTLNFYREQEVKIRSSMSSQQDVSSSKAKMSLIISPVSNHVTKRSGSAAATDAEENTGPDSAALRKWQEDMSDDCCIICRESLFESGSNTQTSMILSQHDGSTVLLPCAHIFHKRCICLWLEKREACVICKAQTKPADLIVIERPQARTVNMQISSSQVIIISIYNVYNTLCIYLL
jgi:hypothetical protein